MRRFLLALLVLLVAAAAAYFFFGPPRSPGAPQPEVTPTGDNQAGSTSSSASERPAQSPEPEEDEVGSRLPEATEAAEVTPREQSAALDSSDVVSAKVAAEAARPAPSFDVVRVENSGRLVAAGRASPGAVVELRSGGLVVDQVTADARGEWVMLPGAALPAGDHELVLLAHDADETRSTERKMSAGSVVVSVPRQSAAIPGTGNDGSEPTAMARATAEPGEGESAAGAQPLAVLLPDDPEEAPRIMQGPKEGLKVGDLSLESLSYDRDGRLTIDGRVVPQGRVFVYVDNEFFDQALGDGEGRWRARPERTVSEGLHQLRLDQVDQEGRVLARLETPFMRSDFVGGMSADGHFVVVQPGNSLWRIARGTYGRGVEYTLIFDANRDQIRDPDLIYPGQIFLLPQDG